MIDVEYAAWWSPRLRLDFCKKSSDRLGHKFQNTNSYYSYLGHHVAATATAIVFIFHEKKKTNQFEKDLQTKMVIASLNLTFNNNPKQPFQILLGCM